MVKETPMFSLSRAKLLAVLKKKEPLNKEQLSRESGLSRASVSSHLKFLKAKKLIIEKPDKTKLGKPIFITTNKADTIPISILKKFELIFPEEFKK